VCLLFFVAHTILGLGEQLAGQMGFGHLSYADQMRLASLYPLADIGAGLSEEVVFRFGLLASLMALMRLQKLAARTQTTTPPFGLQISFSRPLVWGLSTYSKESSPRSLGGVLLATAIAPPTWAGLTLGYVYRRFGIESVFGAHMAGDVFIPVFWTAWAQLH
jgi:hypothetical protein